MIRRAIFSGSSALSSIALMFELMMSDSREKTPISEPFVSLLEFGLLVGGLLVLLQRQKMMRAIRKPAIKKPQLSIGRRPSQLPTRDAVVFALILSCSSKYRI